MKKQTKQIWQMARAFVAIAVACLFFAQFLNLHPQAHHANAGAGVSAASVTVGAHCDPGKGGANHRSGDHSECCVFCSAGVRDAIALPSLILTGVVALPEPPIVFVAFESIDAELDPGASGWASSWSATAPPRAA